MKRKVLGAVLGVVASAALVASSHGQGSVFFLNYASDVNAPVTFGTAAANFNGHPVTVGMAVGSEFSAALEFSLDGGATFTTLSQAAAGAGNAYPSAFLSTDGNSGSGAGYFQGPVVTIPGYTSGSIQFKVDAFTGGADFNSATWRGQSPVLTMASIATGTTQPGDLVGLQGFSVNPVPEPTVFALAGIGAAALMIVRRKK